MKYKFEINGTIKEFDGIGEAEKWLNELNYYCKNVYLQADFEGPWIYDENTNLDYEMENAETYGNGKIKVYQIFE